MAGLVPAIHAVQPLRATKKKANPSPSISRHVRRHNVDARRKAGMTAEGLWDTNRAQHSWTK